MTAILILAAFITSVNLGVTDACSNCKLGDGFIASGSKWLTKNCNVLNECRDGVIESTDGFRCPKDSHCTGKNCACNEYFQPASFEYEIVTSCIKDLNFTPCDGGWKLFNGWCYGLISDKKNWFEARAACEMDYGGHLTEIRNGATNVFMKKFVKEKPDQYWIAINDRKDENRFRILDEMNEITFTDWFPSQPDSWGNEDCVHMQIDDGRWNDRICSFKTAFSCQRKPGRFVKPCQSGWDSHNGNCFKAFPIEKNWNEAKASCEDLGGYLAEIFDDETNTFLQTLASRRPGNYWIGLTGQKLTDSWIWSTSNIKITSDSYTAWGNRQPSSDADKEHCVELNKLIGYGWNDNNCNYNSNYICQRKPGVYDKVKCPAGSSFHSGSLMCFTLITDKKTWTGARDSCAKKNGHLLEIRSSSINDHIVGQIKKYPSHQFYIGANDRQSEGKFVWNDGPKLLGWKNWDNGEPNNDRGLEDCAVIRGADPFKWNDIACYRTVSYICQCYIYECVSFKWLY